MSSENLSLVYTILCDDVRLEMGNKLSMMGVFQNILVERLPVSLIKFAVVTHWRGQGSFNTEVRILTPNREKVVVTSNDTPVELTEGGYTDNVSFFVNVQFQESGTYWVQTLANTMLLEEFPLIVTDAVNAVPEKIDDQVDEIETVN